MVKKLYKTGKIHPSPPPSGDLGHRLSILPAAILTLTAVLSPEDREVLAYLLSSAADGFGHRKPVTAKSRRGGDHPPAFGCDCFRCYTTFWARWDASPNRHVIHDIIDAYEGTIVRSDGGKAEEEEESGGGAKEEEIKGGEGGGRSDGGDEAEEKRRGSVSRIASFIGGRLWGVWGH
ncbi:hypothetical protein QJS10_CPB15g01498 [Acorus calamus]|uniref:Uncharacterized protein n=1 Tax=Acorus calamus TaxID=4465 RepID=A0AAV9D5X1_ACOCL|nr:hypothetical protein QJS10_CPB15g01498 [Acorus calamus]